MPMLSHKCICNKFIEVNFCVGYMVSQPNRLFQRLTTMSLINKIDFITYWTQTLVFLFRKIRRRKEESLRD